MKENCSFQYEHCDTYRRILEEKCFSPDDIHTVKDLERLPFIPTTIFKHHHLFSMSRSKMAVKATSSGTKGVFSEIGFEMRSIWYMLQMAIRVTWNRKLLSLIPTHYIILGYKPHKGNRTAITKTTLATTLMAPAIDRTFALTYREGSYQVDLEKMIKKLEQCGKSNFPTRIVSFPAYLYFMLQMMDDRNMQINLPKGSKITMGGGWKKHYAEQVDKETVYRLAKKVLNVDEENIVEFFGAVEHPILYCDCPKHHFHVPAYSRVLIRDVHTLKPVPNGQIGLVNLLTPLVKATPILSVMTDDLGILHNGENCGCGCKSPYLQIIGRVGMKDIKTCAAGADAILQGGEQ